MGVDATDYDGDGWQDLFVANIDQEFFSLYHNQKGLTFTDEPGEIGPATQLLSGWGLKFFDYDNDGDPDLLLVNGHPDDLIEMRLSRVKYKEPLLMFENTGRAFKNVSAQSGSVFNKEFSGRGMAVGDFDNDGDLDVLISNNGQPPSSAQRWRQPQQLAWSPTSRNHKQPRRSRGSNHVESRRCKPKPAKNRWRQLPCVTRSARGARSRISIEDREPRDSMAERQGGQAE